MRLYGAIQKVEPQDDGTVRVYGIATSEALDEQGEIVRADAIRAAIPDYMRFPALREMHQLSAAGTTLEAEVCEDGTTRIVAHVVDPVAVSKVRNQVYRGFSIGGRVTDREAGNPKAITGLVLNEISLVDRPANPEAIFDCWKAAAASNPSPGFAEPDIVNGRAAAVVQQPLAQEAFNAPIQIWACTVPEHRHLAKTDALKCLNGDTGPTEQGRAKAVAKAATANDEKPVLQESGEIRDGAEIDDLVAAPAAPRLLGTAAVEADLERVAAPVRSGRPDVQRLATGIEKAKHSLADQVLLNMAYFACDQCLNIGGLSVDAQANMDRARYHLQEAGAMPAPLWIAEGTTNTGSPLSVQGGSLTADGTDIDMMNVLAVVTEVVCKQGRAHENLMDLAHGCLETLTDGSVCEQTAKVGARHSKETLEHFRSSHCHLVAAGASCDMPGVDIPSPTIKLASGARIGAGDQVIATPDPLVERAALAKVLGEVVPMLERLAKRVDEIARTPLPPLTMAKGTVAISKEQDRGNNVGSGDPELSPDAIAAALSKMSKEEQTLTLIKASYATPIRIAGSASDHP
jgi:hypothetical protein